MLTFSLWGDKCEHHWHNSCVTMSRWLQYTDNHHCVVVTVCPITVCCSLFFIWHRDIRARKMWVHDMILRETKRVPEWTQMKVLCRCFKFLFFFSSSFNVVSTTEQTLPILIVFGWWQKSQTLRTYNRNHLRSVRAKIFCHLDEPFHLYCQPFQITLIEYCCPFIQKCTSDPTSGFHWAAQPGAAPNLHAGMCPRALTVKSIWDTKPLMMRGCWGKAGTLTSLLNADGFWTTLTPLDSGVHLGQITHMVLFIWPVRDSGIIGPPCFFFSFFFPWS